MNAKIINIFPIPIYKSKLNRKFTNKELSFVDQTKFDVCKNVGNTHSKNFSILNEKPFANIKKELNLIIEDYFEKVLSAPDKVTPYVTQSWLNYTEKNQFHHMHQHSNSLVSGVLYINCNNKFDKIKFFKDKYETIKIEVKKWNLWNSEFWWFSLKTGDVILFPSSLTHMVDNKKGENTRISLAFNVFI